MSVLVAQPELGLVCRLPPRNAVAGFIRRFPVVGMNQPLPRADMRLDFIVFVTKHLLPPRRVDDGVALEVPVPHTLLRAGERQLQPLLALPQCLFRPLLLRDIEVRPDNPHHRSAGLTADRQSTREYGDVVPVLVPEPELSLVLLLPLLDRVVKVGGPRTVRGMEQRLPRLYRWRKLVVVEPKHLLPAVRIDDVTGLEVPVPHALACTRKREAEPFFARTKMLLDLTTLSDVVQDYRDCRTIAVVEPRYAYLVVEGCGVQVNNREHIRRRLLAENRPVDPFEDLRVTVAVEERHHRPTDKEDGVGRARRLCHCRIGVADHGIHHDEDAVGRGFHHGAKPHFERQRGSRHRVWSLAADGGPSNSVRLSLRAEVEIEQILWP